VAKRQKKPVQEVVEDMAVLTEAAGEAETLKEDVSSLRLRLAEIQKDRDRLKGMVERYQVNAGITDQDLLNLSTVNATISFGREHSSGERFVVLESRFIGRKIRAASFLEAVQNLRHTKPTADTGHAHG
jgi:hypothetical protein